MKRICIPITLVLSILTVNTISFGRDDFPVPEGPYLGQKPPGLIAEVFAPGVVTTEHMEFFGSFTPDLKEFYFKRKGGEFQKSTLVVIQNRNNRWVESVVSPDEASVGEPSVSTDGNIIYLDNRYIERTDSGWSAVKSLGVPFKDIPIMRLTASANGTYVFDEREKIGTLRYSRLIDGKREAPRAFWQRHQRRVMDSAPPNSCFFHSEI